ncbi:hypothetical protein [Bartonella tamiae]|uniref:hypothetical protein n=1 Tax=Bartonella tamiae TaxID=373638 RepID=UPI00026E77A5|nr:hypothetical protein [Bartonella tamiae]EJF92644.1 hypothetical protein MEG_01814 [Bartonella tamiae Th307]
MNNWWEDAPLASSKSNNDKWWENSPMATQDTSTQINKKELPGGGNLYKLKDANGRSVVIRANSLQEAEQLTNREATNNRNAKASAHDEELLSNLIPKSQSALSGATQGATFNFADEMTGGLKAIPTLAGALNPFSDTTFEDVGNVYQRERDNERDKDDLSLQANPKSYIAGNVAGAIVPTIAATVATGGVGGGASAAATTGRVAQLLQTGAKLSAIGATQGAVSGFGAGNGFQDSLQNSGKNAAIGAVAAPIIGGAVSGASKAGQKIIPHFMPSFRAGQRELQELGINNKAANIFNEAVKKDEISDVGMALSNLGKDAMPLDLGHNLQAYAGAIANTPGKGKDILQKALSNRQSGASSRISATLDNGLGKNANVLDFADDIIARRSQAAKPLYEQAYNKVIEPSDEFSSLLSRPSIKQAFKEAEIMAMNEGIQGSPTTSIRNIDLAKRALDDMINRETRAGNNNAARILMEQKNSLLQIADKAVPEYAAARNVFSSETAIKNALEEGQKAFQNKMTPDQLNRTISKLSAPEKEAFMTGARSAVSDMMGTARHDTTKVIGEFNKGYNRDKLASIIGGKEADNILNTLAAENTYNASKNYILGNSLTFARHQAAKDLGIKTNDGDSFFKNLANLKFGDAAAIPLDKLKGTVAQSLQEKTNSSLSRLLTAKQPEAKNMLDALLQISNARSKATLTQGQKDMISKLLSRGFTQATSN